MLNSDFLSESLSLKLYILAECSSWRRREVNDFIKKRTSAFCNIKPRRAMIVKQCNSRNA